MFEIGMIIMIIIDNFIILIIMKFTLNSSPCVYIVLF